MPSRSRRSPKAAANPPAPAGEASGLDTAVLQQAIDRHLAGHPAEAEPVYERFVAAGLGYTAAYTNLAAIELARGRADRAIALWQSALRIDENLPDCWYDLGNEWRRRGDTNAARRHLERAVELRPGFAEARCNLSSLLIALADADAALAQAEAALKLRPDFLEAAVNRTTALRLLGRLEEAEASARRAVELAPSSALALGALGSVLRDRDCLVEAEQVLRRALVGEPLSPELSINLAMVLQKQGRLDDGVAVLAAASAQHRDRGDLFSQLGQLQFIAGRYLEAMQAYRRQAALQPRLAEVHYNLAVVLKEMGQLEASAAAYQQALHCQPDHENALHGLSYTLNFGQLESMPRLAARLRAWTRRHYPAEDLTPFLGRRLPLAGGKLRIGFLSAEIGRHAVAWFLGSVLEHLDRDSFEVFLYESADRQGDGEEREALTRLATATVQLHGMDDAAARQRILADQIDVLVDTTACMRGSRLRLLARRCAPVQCHYIGFHGTTGVPAVDWTIGDPVYTPPAFDHHLLERVWRLPRCFVAYRLPPDLPAAAAPPAEAPLTLGCFNNLIKVRDDCLDLWAEVLRGLPEARLLLKDVRCRDLSVQERILGGLALRGIGAERVELVPRVHDWNAHMALYNRIDLALDTVPLNSGTTAFDALVMGVPLVCLRGDWMGGCLTATMLDALGRGEWITFDRREHCERIWQLARDRQALRALRQELRRQVHASSLCDGADLCRALEQAWRGMISERQQHLERLQEPTPLCQPMQTLPR